MLVCGMATIDGQCEHLVAAVWTIFQSDGKFGKFGGAVEAILLSNVANLSRKKSPFPKA